MLQNIKVSPNRAVTPKRIVVGNQFETGVEQIHFDLPDMEGHKYLILNKPNKKESYPIPLDDGTFYVDSRVTYYLDGVWIANVVISKSAVTTGKLNPDVVTFISDDIILIVKNNYINNEYLKDLPLPQNLQIVYDKLFDTYTQIKSDYDSGAFDGKDGYSPTLDVTPIDNGNRITINDINGEKEIDVTNGIDGQSAYELAVKNGFEGTEQEWLESLRYDHSDEFTQLAEQVKKDAQSSAENAANAETAMNQANQTAQDNIEAIQQASEQAQEDIASAKTTSVNAVVQAQQTAEQSIATKHGEAVQAVEQAQSTAETAINAKQAESVNAVETAKEEATQAIETGKTEAVTAIETAKDEAIEEIENTGVPLEDIEKLAIKETAQGNPTIINDGADWRLQSLNVYGQSSQDGEPSPDNPVEIISKEVSEIEVTGASLITYPFRMGTQTIKGVTFTVNDDQSVTINGANDGTGDSVITINSNIRFKKGNAISTGLIADKDDANVHVNAYDVGNIGTNSKVENKIVGSDSNNYVILLVVKSGATIDNVTVKFMRNYGATLLPYEPYKSQTITLSEPITLRGVPVASDGNVTIDGQQYVSDVITEKDGVIGVDRFNAYEKLTMPYYNSTFFRYEATLSKKCKDASSILCNVGVYSDVAGNNNSVINRGVRVANGTLFILGADKSDDVSNVQVCYSLAEPTFEPLPEADQEAIRKLKTFYPNTVIQNGCWNEVEYVADTQKWIEKKLTGVTELALGGK